MRTIGRAPIAWAALLGLAAWMAVAPPAGQAAAEQAAAGRRSELLWDTYGVPHVFAATEEDLFRMFGWAQMQNHADLLLRLYGRARGRAAEYWGISEMFADRWVWMNRVPQRAERWYQAQTPAFKRNLDAFARGINEYAEAHPAQIAADVRPVLPVSPVDVLAHVQRVVYFQFVAPEQLLFGPKPLDMPPASAGWAIAPARSASGKALLMADLHLPWRAHFTLFEAQLSGPGVDAYGVTFVGFPVLGVAFNDQLGWAHTVGATDAADLYQIQRDGERYLWDGAPRPFETETRTLKVRQQDGSVDQVPLVLRRTVHGPVIGEVDGKPLALRVAGVDEPGLCEQWWDMARAKSLREFEPILARLQLPMFTVIYADRDGHIMHLFNGRIPVRPPGDDKWNRIVPGDGQRTLWQETHVYADLPRVVDPPGGWVQNSNDPPWTATLPPALVPSNFPSYMAPVSLGFRAQRALRTLSTAPRLSMAEVIDAKMSTRMELAERIVDPLIKAARAANTESLTAAADVLEKWDRRADAASRGAILFEQFAGQWIRREGGAFVTPWSLDSPLDTPAGLKDPAAAAEALDAAAAEVRKRYGALDVAWGEIHRLRLGDLDLPSSGISGDPFGVMRVINYRQGADGKREAESGDAYSAVVEFAAPVRAKALLGYGNASQPGSPHRTDQLALFAKRELRPVWRTRAEIEQHLETRRTFGPAQTQSAAAAPSPEPAQSPEAIALAKAEAAARIGPRKQPDTPPLPASAHGAAQRAEIDAAYRFAAEHPEIMSYVPCFCGCERGGHSNTADCFVRSRAANGDVAEWEPHGLLCDVCVTVAERARLLHAQGKTLTEIRKAIDREFAPTSPRRTPTPFPPAHQH